MADERCFLAATPGSYHLIQIGYMLSDSKWLSTAAALPGLKHTERIRKPKRHSSRITNTGRPAVKDKH